ncbi:MAG: PIN domain-containing protein [Ktedonobacteraceae bacterium]
MIYYIDTNIFIRFITGDDEKQSPPSFEVIKKLSTGELEATTNEAVIAEICYILSSKKLPYHLTQEEIKDRLVPVLSMRGLRIEHKRILFDALDIFTMSPGLNFVDALNVAHMNDEGIEPIISYDHHFDQIKHVNRQEPTKVLDALHDSTQRNALV